MSSGMNCDIYYFFILYGLSFLICSFFLFISIKNKLYKKIVTEYIQYILIGEIVFCLSKLLCFCRKREDNKISTYEEDTIIKITQLSIEVFSNTMIITSTFFVALKIYDSIHMKSKLYSKNNTLLWSRIIIGAVSLAFSVFVGCYHGLILVYDKNNKNNEKDLVRCNQIVCGMINVIGYFIDVIYLLIMLAVFILCVLNYIDLKQKYNKLDQNEELIKQKLESLTQRVLFFPLGSCLLWFSFLTMQIIISFFDDSFQDNNLSVLKFMFIFTGVRGLLYSLLCLLMNSDFKKTIFFCSLNSEMKSINTKGNSSYGINSN